MKNLQFFSIVLALFSITMIVSCQKDKNDNADTTAATDNALAEGESSKVIDAVNSVAESYGIGKPDGTAETMEDSIFAPCATVTVDTMDATKTITIDFGPVPCQCINWDNKFRQGKITATWSGGYREAGTVITVVTTDYYVGYSAATMNQHDYVKTITNEGLNANGNLHYSVVVSAATVTLYTGETITWQATRDREWIAGESTLLPLDDVYLITGGASGIDRNGNAFTVTITSPLQVQFCPWIVSGTVETIHEGSPARILDYGNGECDNKATVTINGVEYPISL